MTTTPSIHNKKAHDVNMGFQDLLASYQRVSKEQQLLLIYIKPP